MQYDWITRTTALNHAQTVSESKSNKWEDAIKVGPTLWGWGQLDQAGERMGQARPFRFGVIAENVRSPAALLDTARKAENLGICHVLAARPLHRGALWT